MISKRTFTITAFLVLAFIIFINIFKKDLWETNEELLKQEVLAIGDSVYAVKLTDVTPFEWDVVYTFDPYIPKETIYETVGYKWDSIRETVSEGMNQIVFLKDGKVVCYLYGYPENNGYGIDFRRGKYNKVEFASVLSVDDDLTFQVVKRDEVIYLMSL
ncbi:hypothetical protein [Ureibacillus manganicus]|uniref:Lipoprotein n=1 Tax=Ureibacillus manganicus DSM 26584 TaxID=1384049 RepID=A0A0A3IT31_9BACL|nr:hypothetical protein [Ureibacillus manganicus]KGR77987.1 lipoprotein [Ureibacillus manganicus DSM 26584]